jgi:hypothetical protein
VIAYTDQTAGSANLKLFFAYFVLWILIVVNTEMLIVRNGFSYDIRDDIKFSLAFPAEFAQTLQFSEVRHARYRLSEINDVFLSDLGAHFLRPVRSYSRYTPEAARNMVQRTNKLAKSP